MADIQSYAGKGHFKNEEAQSIKKACSGFGQLPEERERKKKTGRFLFCVGPRKRKVSKSSCMLACRTVLRSKILGKKVQ